MLKKILKYDLRAIYKYWWIGAVASFALSLLGSFGISFLNSEKDIPVPIEIFSYIAIVLTIIGYVAFIFLAQVLVFIRYYKNFYSDEGYLTFTLPAKRISLLNSKLITGTLSSLSTFIFCLLSGGMMLLIGFRNDIFTKETYEAIMEAWKEFIAIFETKADVAMFISVIVSVMLTAILTLIASNQFMYLCISIGASISKKAKVISAIGIYYFAGSVVSFIISMFSIFVSSAFVNWTNDLPENEYDILFTLIPLILMFFIGIICVALYAIHYRLLDKKLNLS